MRHPFLVVDNTVDDKDEKAEINRLLSGIHRRYGYDFSNYSYTSLKRRLYRALAQEGLKNFAQLLDKISHDEKSFDEFLKNMSITVTEMFRDPLFYKALRERIIPVLKTYPFVKIWHAGCATGEEVYSMAILLHEEEFLGRTRIYATDFNKHSLDLAEKGIYPLRHLAACTENYRKAGGKRDFFSYYSDGYKCIKFKDFLKERVTFSYHNLVTDGVFGEMNLILCRNVLIYFDKTLRNHVLLKFSQSLCHGGFLALGSKESVNFTAIKHAFEPIERKERIYRKYGEAHVA